MERTLFSRISFYKDQYFANPLFPPLLLYLFPTEILKSVNLYRKTLKDHLEKKQKTMVVVKMLMLMLMMLMMLMMMM